MTKFNQYHLTSEDMPLHRCLVLKCNNQVIKGVCGISTMHRVLYVFKSDDIKHTILATNSINCPKEILRPKNLQLFATDVEPPELLLEWNEEWIV